MPSYKPYECPYIIFDEYGTLPDEIWYGKHVGNSSTTDISENNDLIHKYCCKLEDIKNGRYNTKNINE